MNARPLEDVLGEMIWALEEIVLPGVEARGGPGDLSPVREAHHLLRRARELAEEGDRRTARTLMRRADTEIRHVRGNGERQTLNHIRDEIRQSLG